MTKTPNKARARSAVPPLPLVVLQVLFTFLLTYHVGFTSLLRGQDRLVVALFFLTIVMVCVTDSLLQRKWAVAVLVVADATILMRITEGAQTIVPWAYLGYVLVMLVAAFSPTPPQFLGLTGLLCATYAISVSRFASLAAEHGLVIPVLLAMAMVYVTQLATTQSEVKSTEEAEEKARPEGTCDPLTGLPNRADFIERVWKAIHCAQNTPGFVFAVIFIDLDGFKPINDGLGHKAGDAVLIEMAKRLQACLRKGDVVARFGGDEFTLLINNVTRPDDAVRVAERVLRKVKDPIDVARKQVQVGASIGIALSTNLHSRPEDLIRDADLAMYRAKSGGKGRYEMSDQLRDTKVPEGVREKLKLQVPTPSSTQSSSQS
jgi:diguanylate cyclase (GGDEF)-like protein